MRPLSRSIAVAIVLLIGVGANAAFGDRPERVRTVFIVEGMHCDGCSSAIRTTLESMDGVESARADHQAGRAEAKYDPRAVTVNELEKAIEKLGYTVTKTETETVDDD